MKANLKAPNYTTLSLSEPWTCHWRNIQIRWVCLQSQRPPLSSRAWSFPVSWAKWEQTGGQIKFSCQPRNLGDLP